MSFSKKYTFPLFESVCVLEGEILNPEYHEFRFQDSCHKFFWKKPQFALFDGISIPKAYQSGRIKLRISYRLKDKEVSFHPYKRKVINSLRVIHDDTIDYDIKFEDRSHLTTLFEKRDGCDDILIVKNGLVSDSSYANIIFRDENGWVTPRTPLLQGTKRAKLLAEGFITERTIKVEDVNSFQGFQLINALLDFDEDHKVPINGIKESK